MKRIFAIILAVGLTLNYAVGQEAVRKVSYKLFDNFETGELFSWEPYPYAQDIGSHRLFYAQKSPTYKNSQYALATLMPASDAVELYNGFTKRLDLFTSPDTKIKFAVFFQSDRSPETLELSLGTFEGCRYMYTIHKPEANRWVEIEIPAGEFEFDGKALATGEHIQVVTIKASYATVYWLNTYTIFMDDFMINGERNRRFVTSEPVSTNLEMFNVPIILNKHFFYGDNISLKAAPEGNIQLSRVRGTLVDSQGRIIKDNIPFTRHGNEWVNESIYKPGKQDPRGQWEIRLTGQDNKGKEMSSAFGFLMPGKQINEYPRLFFSKEELKHRLSNEKSPIAKRIFDRAKEKTDFMKVDIDAIHEGIDRTSENLVGGPYAKNTVGFNAYAAWNNPNVALADVISQGSLHYAFTGDRASGEKAKQALLKLSSFSKWNNDWMLERRFWSYYPVGYTLSSVSYGYDMLHELLTAKEKKLVRDAIMEKGLKHFHRDMVEMNRMPSNNSNHIAVLVSGAILAATVMYGEEPENPYMEPYLSGILTKAKTFIDRTYYADGSYGEPKSGYMNMASRAIVELLATVERNFGIDYSTTTNVENFYKYPLYAIHSNGSIQDFGDGISSFRGFNEIHSEWFVHRTGNPFLYNYIKPYWEAGNGGFIGYLWYRDDIIPVSRKTLPTSKVFIASGMVMRSGWDDQSSIISTHVGPNSNHYHYDQGSFQIMTNGDALLSDPGSGGYYSNLEFLTYNVQAIAHNVMLVDHDPESQAPAHYDNGIAALRAWPTAIHSFNGKNADALESDLTTVYKGKLDKYTRTLLYIKSGPLFVFDQVKSKSSDGHLYNWLFHAPQNAGNQSSIAYQDKRMTVERPNARLTMDVISPEISSVRIRERNIQNESFINLISKPGLSEVYFLGVIFPEAKPVSGDFGPTPKTSRMDSPGWIGARVEHQEAVDFGFFRIENNAADTVGGFTTDAKRFTSSFNDTGVLLKAYFEGSNFSGSGLSLRSDVPLTCAVEIAPSGMSLEIQSIQASTLTVTYAQQPHRVLLNGTMMRSAKYDLQTKKLTLQVPSGKSEFSIE